MFAYIIRRVLFSVPIVFGVMLLTFFLFFVIQRPDAMARRVLGPKATTNRSSYRGRRSSLSRITF